MSVVESLPQAVRRLINFSQDLEVSQLLESRSVTYAPVPDTQLDCLWINYSIISSCILPTPYVVSIRYVDTRSSRKTTSHHNSLHTF